MGLGTYGGELTGFHAESPSDDGHVQALLGVYLLGGMSAGDEAAVRAHLAVCKQCRDEHDYLAVVPRWLDLVKRQAADDAAADRETRPAAEGHRLSPRFGRPGGCRSGPSRLSPCARLITPRPRPPAGPSALIFGHAAPHPVVLIPGDRVLEALGTHLASAAQRLRLLHLPGRTPCDREKQVRIGRPAGGQPPPVNRDTARDTRHKIIPPRVELPCHIPRSARSPRTETAPRNFNRSTRLRRRREAPGRRRA